MNLSFFFRVNLNFFEREGYEYCLKFCFYRNKFSDLGCSDQKCIFSLKGRQQRVCVNGRKRILCVNGRKQRVVFRNGRF